MTMNLSLSTQAPSEARHWLGRREAGRLPEETRRVAELLVSELVANAVRHSSEHPEPIEIRVRDEGGRIRVEVVGGGSVPEPADEGGFGLRLVGSLADAWGVEGESPTTVWFEVSGERSA